MMSDQLPAGWLSLRVGELLAEKPCNGLSVKGSDSPPGVAALKLSAMGEHGFDYSDVRYLPVEGAEVQDIGVRRGDFFVSRGNGSLHLVGRGTSAQEPPGFVIFPDTMIRLRLRDPLRTTRWVDTIWACPQVRRQIETKAKTTAGIYKISQADLCDVWVNVPPAHEQQRIVEEVEKHLTRIDAGVAALERVQANLKRYRASVLKAAVEGRLVPTEAELARKERRDYEPATKLLARILKERRARWEADELAKLKAKGRAPTDDRWKAKYKEPAPPDTSQLPELPEGWCWATVEQVGDVLLGRQRAPQFLTGRWSRPYLRVANIKDDALDLSDIEQMDFDAVHFEKYRLLPGDILVSEGQSPELVGQSAIYRGGVDGLCFQKTLHRFRAVPGGPSAKFAQVVFRAHVKTGLFTKAASITTNIAHLTLEKFVASRFPLPPEHEQSRIVEEVERRLTVADDAERAIRAQLARADRLRRSVLRDAFEGKLVPQAPAQPVAQPVHSKTNGSSRAASAVRTRVRRASLPLREEEAP